MSIYATIGEIGIKRFGDKDFINIFIQGVPPHIDHVGPQWEFLPPPVDPDGAGLRAVFFVEAGDEKGTERCGQEYVKPLLILTGEEYDNIRFSELLVRLEDALDRKYGKRPGAIYLAPNGLEKRIY